RRKKADVHRKYFGEPTGSGLIFCLSHKSRGHYLEMNPTSQYRAMPTTTVPARERVLRAKSKVGSATRRSGLEKSRVRGFPEVKRIGATRALRIATGTRSSQSVSQRGSSLRERRARGRRRGR